MSERGFAGSLAFDLDPGSDRGLSLGVQHSVGAQASGGMDTLLGRPTLEGLAANDDGAEEARRFEATLGYGFALFDERYTGTPEVGMVFTATGREVRLGWRIAETRRTGLVFGLDVEGTRRESGEDSARAPARGRARLAARGGANGRLRDPARGLAA